MNKAYILRKYSGGRKRIDIQYTKLKMIDAVFGKGFKAVCSSRFKAHRIIKLRHRAQVTIVNIFLNTSDVAVQVGIIKQGNKMVPVAFIGTAYG